MIVTLKSHTMTVKVLNSYDKCEKSHVPHPKNGWEHDFLCNSDVLF